MTVPRPGARHRRDAAWLVFTSLSFFILLLPISSYVAALPYIKLEWDLNNTQAALVYSASLAGFVVSALLLMPLTDRVGARRILIGSALLSAVAHLLFPLFASSGVGGAVVRLGAGVGFMGVYTPGLRIIAERFPGVGRGAAMGLFVTAQYAAHGSSLAITGALMSYVGWREAYLTMSIAAVFAVPAIYLLLRSHPDVSNGQSSGKLNLRVLRNPPVRFFILGYSLHALHLHAVRAWLPGFLLVVLAAGGGENPSAKAATVAGLAMLIGSAGPVAGGFLSGRFGRPDSATAILALGGACAFLVGWTADLPWALIVALATVYGWAVSADSAIYQTGVTEASPHPELGSSMAMASSLGVLGGIVGPIIFGATLDLAPEQQQWGLSFSTLGLVALAAILAMLRLRKLF